jgi:hypothetical protein
MSKRDLKNYLSSLKKVELEEQILVLYDKFPNVKTYYNFVFNPNEKNLIKDAKLKISNEYFPIRGNRPKMRRSVAQKYIKHFISLGVDVFLIADLMFYNLEIAQSLTLEKKINAEAFYKNMLLSFNQSISFCIGNLILDDFLPRIHQIEQQALNQNWPNAISFHEVLERFQY